MNTQKNTVPDLHVVEVEYGSPHYHAMLALRQRLLRTPLGIEFTADELEQEPSQIHFAALMDGEPVATLLAMPLDHSHVRFRQMAVKEEMQGRGVGKYLLHHAQSHMKARGIAAMILHARVDVQEFYEKQGYQAVGEAFIEVTIAHIRMEKKLT